MGEHHRIQDRLKEHVNIHKSLFQQLPSTDYVFIWKTAFSRGMEPKISTLYSSGLIVRAARAHFTSSNSISVSTF